MSAQTIANLDRQIHTLETQIHPLEKYFEEAHES